MGGWRFARVVYVKIVGWDAPDFSLTDLQGSLVQISRVQDRPVMLVHLQVYCHTCRSVQSPTGSGPTVGPRQFLLDSQGTLALQWPTREKEGRGIRVP